ncbi:hypothetical protein C8R47DRAFT_400505 [Mycena vitilis]|nr:hypothetical protein C8R47DRAFT_400505 [Mycena vitilis]
MRAVLSMSPRRTGTAPCSRTPSWRSRTSRSWARLSASGSTVPGRRKGEGKEKVKEGLRIGGKASDSAPSERRQEKSCMAAVGLVAGVHHGREYAAPYGIRRLQHSFPLPLPSPHPREAHTPILRVPPRPPLRRSTLSPLPTRAAAPAVGGTKPTKVGAQEGTRDADQHKMAQSALHCAEAKIVKSWLRWGSRRGRWAASAWRKAQHDKTEL